MPRDDSRSAPVDAVFLNDLLPRVIAAFNAHDVAAFVAMMTEDVVLEHSSTGLPVGGRPGGSSGPVWCRLRAKGG